MNLRNWNPIIAWNLETKDSLQLLTPAQKIFEHYT